MHVEGKNEKHNLIAATQPDEKNALNVAGIIYQSLTNPRFQNEAITIFG